MPSARAAATASSVSRNGASVVQLAPTIDRGPSAKADIARLTISGSASAYRRGVMIARTFVAKRTVDDDKVWCRSCGFDLACRSKAYEHFAARGKQLLRDQDGK